MNSLACHGLTLNKNKSFILTNAKELKNVEEFEGIKITKQIKYLGF